MKLAKGDIIYLLIFLNPVFEIIYSAFYRLNIDIPLNQVFRLATLGIFLLLVRKRKTLKYIMAFFLIYFAIWILQLVNGYSEWSLKELAFIFKAVYAISLPFLFVDFIKSGTVEIKRLVRITIYSAVIIMISVCVSPFGFGYEGWQSTAYRTGYVGWFTFGNYLTVVLLIVFSLLIYSQEIKQKILLLLLVIISLVLIGNKAGLVGLGGYGLGLWLYYICHGKFTRRKWIMVVVGITLCGVMMPSIFRYMQEYIANQILLFKAYGYNNVLSFLLSNRDLQIYFVQSYVEANESNQILGFISGYGYNNINSFLTSMGNWAFIEMDFYALRYYLGCIPVALWMIIDFKMIKGSIIKFFKTKSLANCSLVLGTGITLVHSIFTGHVIFDSMVMIYFAVLYAVVQQGKES